MMGHKICFYEEILIIIPKLSLLILLIRSPVLLESAAIDVGCFGLNGPLRQYFSLYWAVSQREGERKEK